MKAVKDIIEKAKSLPKQPAPAPITDLPPDNPIFDKAPTIDIRENASYRHFTTEERHVVRNVLSLDPDAGWHDNKPVFTTRYEYLYPITKEFALNGQPSEVEKRRVWNTQFGKCEVCDAITAKWIDRYMLTAGFYCDGCHKDFYIGSYLEWELNRKLPNSIISDYQGFLADDPNFADFRLWEPGMLTHLGAGMATGKSTQTYKAMIELAMQGLGQGIIAVPRVSLARFLSHQLRKTDPKAWGLWHEGVDKSEKFIGKYGAIVCLPSLPRAIQEATEYGVDRLYLAIDEVDFGYNLLSLNLEQSESIKACLRDAIQSTGLVVAGQTESTLALEALADELECEQIQAFYNKAPPADGHVTMHNHPDIEGKAIHVTAGGIDNIANLLKEGHNVYVFCSSRRDGDLIADEFKAENPVIYNAYTKGDPRADAVLHNQRLTDSRLFIGTSAAGVGISILDPDARTVILNGLNYGSRDASMTAQKGVRDRGRCGVDIHYTDYDLPLPVRPTENEKVSLYHEALNTHSQTSDAGVRKIAYSQALDTLADAQFESFIEYHLCTVGNMPVYHAPVLHGEQERLDALSTRRTELMRDERQERITRAVEILENNDLLTTSEIRKLSNQGILSPEERLAHETANDAAQSVGWDNMIEFIDGKPYKIPLGAEESQVAIQVVAENINTDRLEKQRRGYMAVNYPKWVQIHYPVDAIRGELLSALIGRLENTVFDTQSLATVVRDVLSVECSSGKPFGTEIESGALGATGYRKARFLQIFDDDGVVDWVRNLIAEWYPALIAKNEDTYVFQHAKNINVRLASFQHWITNQPGVPDGAVIDLPLFDSTQFPDPNAELRQVARFRREGGETIKDIAESFNRNARTIAKWCEGIKPPAPAQRDVLSILGDGQVWKSSDIEKHSRFARQNVIFALKTLLTSGQIRKIKRGYYQKFDMQKCSQFAIKGP